MDRAHLSDLSAFIAIGSHLSFRRAALELGVSSSALSHSLKQLEDRLSIRLINRTTRSVALTEAGQRLYGQLRPAFDGIQTAVEDLNVFRDEPVGTLRLNAPRLALRHVVIPLIAEFNAINPHIRFFVTASDHIDDVVSEGFDAGVRFGESIAEDMIAVPIGPHFKAAVVATPQYFASRERPRHPKDLCSHNCVTYRYPSGKKSPWAFEKGGSQVEVDIEGVMSFDDFECVFQCVMEGSGIGYVFEAQVKAALAQSKLVRVLEDWCPARSGRFCLYYPSRRNLSYGMRAFLDFIRERTKDHEQKRA